MKRIKEACAACGLIGKKMSKEHFWPQWLILRTRTDRTAVRWMGKMISPLSTTFPLCERCNSTFGSDLEEPVSRIFEDLETGKGISDLEAEILVRWLWKLEGLSWIFEHPEGIYTEGYTLKERVLRRIDSIRGSLILAIATIRKIDPTFEDAPLGLDSTTEHTAIFVSGVFSKIAIMVVHEYFELQIPEQFSKYRLSPKPDKTSGAKLFYPQVGFERCTDAVGVTVVASQLLSRLHDRMALEKLSARHPQNLK